MSEKQHIEIMAPAGNFECLMAAIQGGADSVYFGVGNLNMRSHSANNFTNEDLAEVVRICRQHGVKTYLTLNIVVYQTEMEDVRKALEAARDAGISAVIASDMAVIQMARSLGIEIHISTQMNISNFEAAKFYAQFADVIVLARELTLPQVKDISRRIKEENVCGPSGQLLRLELFVHGPGSFRRSDILTGLGLGISGFLDFGLHGGHIHRREIEALKDTVDLAGVFGADHDIRQTVVGFVVFQHAVEDAILFRLLAELLKLAVLYGKHLQLFPAFQHIGKTDLASGFLLVPKDCVEQHGQPFGSLAADLSCDFHAVETHSHDLFRRFP